MNASRILIVTLLLLFAFTAPGQADHGETYSAAYVNGSAITFTGLQGGDYEIEIGDVLLPHTSGAYRVTGGPIVDFCAPTISQDVPPGGSITVWVDSVVWWVPFAPCGNDEPSFGTTGTITVTHI